MEPNFAGYELLSLIGSGGYFEVFKARKDERILAIKRVKRHFMYDRSVIASLKKEADMLQKLEAFRHFPKFIDQGESGEYHYVALEFVDGWTLEQLVLRAKEKHLTLPAPAATRLLLALAEGLEELHRVEIEPGQAAVHGDLKPRNSMVNRDGEIKIIDLGLQGGTFNYMPLERLHDKTVTPYSDVYALGQTAYELLHGERLYKSKTTLEAYFEMRETSIDENSFRADLPEPMKRLLRRSLNQEIPDRFRRIEEIRLELQALAQQGSCSVSDEEFRSWLQSLMS